MKKLFTLLLAVAASLGTFANSFTGFAASMDNKMGNQIYTQGLIQNTYNITLIETDATKHQYNINLTNGGTGTFQMGGVTFSYTNSEAGKTAYKTYDYYIQPNGVDREITIPTVNGEQVKIVLMEACAGILVNGVSRDFVEGDNILTATGSSIVLKNSSAKPKINAILSLGGGSTPTPDPTPVSGKYKIGDLYYNLDASSQTAEVTSQNSSYPYWSTTITTANIPSSVTYNSVPYSVTSIGYRAFQNCTGLTSVTIPNSVTSIGINAFNGCSSLTSIEIPNSVTSIGSSAFGGCTGFPVIGNIRYADTYLIEAVDKTLSTYTIKDGTKWIGSSAFEGCSGLTSVTIPNSVTSIGWRAFSDCSGLTSIEIPNSVTSIGDNAFHKCAGLASVTIGSSVTSIGGEAFFECGSLTSVTLPNSVTSIGNYAFSNCSNLTSIYVPCGELERFLALLKNDSRVKYKPLPYRIKIKTAANGSVVYPKTICDDLVLNAIPDYGYHFVKWSDGNTDNPRTIELTQDTTFEAAFAINTYTIDLRKNRSEMGSVTGGGSFEYLSQRTISASANYGYHFVQWNGVGQQIPQNAISVSQATTIASALSSGATTSTKYTIIGYITGKYGSYTNSYYLSDSPDVAGTFIAFKCASSANIGDCVLVTGYLTNYKGATPETTSGSSLTKIYTPYSNPYSFTLTRDTIITGVFAKNIYTLTLQSSDTTMGSVVGAGQFEYLSKRTIKAIPNYSYHFEKWSDGYMGNPRTITLTRDTIFSAIFWKNPIIRYVYDSSMGYVEGDTTFASQASGNITFRAVPYQGYKFVQWADGNRDNPRTIYLDKDITMKAIFELALDGNCGKDFALTWSLDTATMALNIVGNGELTDNYTYGPWVQKVSIGANVTDIGFEAFEHCKNIKSVILNSSAVVGKDYYYYFSTYSGSYVYYTLTKIFGSGVKEYTFGGHIKRIGAYAFYGSKALTSVVIPEGCEYIGNYAFYGCDNITTISIPSTVTYIGVYAFTTESILKVYNYATTPQDMSITNSYSGYELTLLRGVLASTRLYVPQQSIELYRDTYFWCYFGSILPLQTTPVETTDLTVEVTETTANVIWPQVNGAASYEMIIKDKDGNVICTLVFDSEGRLISMTFHAPSRDKAPQQTQATGFSFTVNGLDSGTGYDLTLTAKNNSGRVLQTKTISFRTNGLEPVENIFVEGDKPVKVLHDSQIYILRGDHVYTLTGAEVK